VGTVIASQHEHTTEKGEMSVNRYITPQTLLLKCRWASFGKGLEIGSHPGLDLAQFLLWVIGKKSLPNTKDYRRP